MAVFWGYDYAGAGCLLAGLFAIGRDSHVCLL